ncbi:MAG: hypothetical protein KDD69_16680 [Bdellovibrionales bacterium]|nr:hypothetical protein [Bdellovibrionales bacterium]
MGGIIVYSFLFAALACGAGIAVFMWLNSKDSSIDQRTYERKFDPGDMVARYRVQEVTDEDTFDAERDLSRYRQHDRQKKSELDELVAELDDFSAPEPKSAAPEQDAAKGHSEEQPAFPSGTDEEPK